MRVGRVFSICFLSMFFVLGLSLVQAQAQKQYTNLAGKKLVIIRGYSKEAIQCIECHSKKTPGIVADWKMSRMAHAGVSCYDCHVVPKNSPMASQCAGIKGTNIYTSPLVSPKTCAKCHPSEVEQFEKSAHAKMASVPVVESKKMAKLMYHYEGGIFMGVPEGDPRTTASKRTGCADCHGGKIELGPDKKPLPGTWPSGIGQRYPDGSAGNCAVCHTRHKFSIAEARKPTACDKCHIGPDHPNVETYLGSQHGKRYHAEGNKWKWDSAPDAWEPGDYSAPTCATCHMSGIGELATTHNVAERLKWRLYSPISDIRKGARGDGMKGRENMKKVCINCHSPLHTESFFKNLDDAVALYNTYAKNVQKMLADLKSKNLLKNDPWKDPVQELWYYLWHHTGRRARMGYAMGGPDWSHWHGFFQIFQLYKDIEDLYNYRIKHGKIEELSPVMSTGPY
ncbi:multiheme c-type cytochrome [Thermodesulfatator indicus]